METVHICPNNKCGHLFLAYYDYVEDVLGDEYSFVFSHTGPITYKAPPIRKTLEAVSAGFVQICIEASIAEDMKLSQIAGMGYRKALEFLIKDYLIREHPLQAEEIKATRLGPCIEKWIPAGRLKDCAKRATWLGNDETHYWRKWANQDITDLKALIRLTSNMVDDEVTAKRYLDEMPSKQEPKGKNS